jgi:hypothetical protein
MYHCQCDRLCGLCIMNFLLISCLKFIHDKFYLWDHLKGIFYYKWFNKQMIIDIWLKFVWKQYKTCLMVLQCARHSWHHRNQLCNQTNAEYPQKICKHFVSMLILLSSDVVNIMNKCATKLCYSSVLISTSCLVPVAKCWPYILIKCLDSF